MLCILFIFIILFSECQDGHRNVPQKCDTFKARHSIPYQDLIDCIYAMPFDPDVRTKAIDAMTDFLDMYIYREYNLNSGPPYFIKQDTLQRVSDLADKDYIHDYDFHADLMEIVGDAKDAHTAYMPPLCFSGNAIALPFGGKSRLVYDTNLNKTVQKLFVSLSSVEGMEANYTRLYPTLADLVTDYVGWEIIEIEKTDAMEYLTNFAIHQDSYSRDKAVRFNDATETFFVRTCMRNRCPNTDSVSFKIRSKDGQLKEFDAKLLSYPLFELDIYGFEYMCGYVGVMRGDSGPSLFKASADPISNNLLRLILDNPLSSQASTFHSGLTLPVLEEHALFHLITPKFRADLDDPEPYVDSGRRKIVYELEPIKEGKYNQLLDGPDIYAYTTVNATTQKTTGILQVRNFYPKDLQKTWKWTWNIRLALKYFKDNNIDRVVIDVRKNPGGILCLGWILIRLLSKYAPKALYGHGNMKSTEFWKNFFCPNNIFAYHYAFVDENNRPNPSTFLSNSISEERNGVMSEYSQNISPECDVFKYVYVNGYLEGSEDGNMELTPIQFEPEDLIFLTDGKCGSTCGMVVKVIQELKLGRIVNQGGVYDWRNEDMSIASFKGASVMMSSMLYSQLQLSLGCFLLCSCTPLRILPGFQMITFAWLEIMQYDEVTMNEPKKLNMSQPIGFTRKKADQHLWNWDFDLNPGEELEGVYDLVIPLFDKCNDDWEVKRDDEACPSGVKNGVAGHPCVNGVFDFSKCVFRGCDDGYYYSLPNTKWKGGECLVMPDEYAMHEDLFSLLAGIVSGIMAIMVCVCCCLCYCYCCIGGGGGWGVFGCFSIYHRKKYKNLTGVVGYVNVINDEMDDDDDVLRLDEDTGVKPLLLGESSINI